MKRSVISTAIFVLIIFSPITAFADDYGDYLSSFDLSAFEMLEGNGSELINELGLNDFSYESLTNISLSSVLNHILSLFESGIKTPINSCSIILAFVILSAFLRSFSGELTDGDISRFYSSISSVIICVFLSSKLTDCIILCCSTVSLCSEFTFAFFPAFCIIVAASGGAVTTFSVNTLLLSLSQGLSVISSVLFIPITNCFIALGICSSISTELNLDTIAVSLKRLITTIISSVSAVFITVLSIKTSVSSKADELGLRSMRFAINSVVPVIGPSISEGLVSIQSYSGMIKSTVGAVGIVAIISVFLPAIVDIAAWRITLFACSMFAEIFDDMQTSKAIGVFRDALMIIQIILILSMLTTVISLGILIAAKTV